MEVHNGIKYAGQELEAFAIAAGVSREQSGVERLSESWTPVIDSFIRPELAFLRGERLGAIAMFVAAVPAEFSIIAFGNDSQSRSLVVIEAAAVGQSGQVVQLESVLDSTIAATLSAAGFAASGRDRRFVPAAGRAFVRSGSDLGNTFGIFLERAISVAGGFVDFKNLPVILRPGDDVIFVGQTVNTAMSVNLKWRERQALPGELQGP